MFAANKLAVLLLLTTIGSVLSLKSVPDVYKKIHVLSVGIDGLSPPSRKDKTVVAANQCSAMLMMSQICPGVLESLKVTTVSSDFVETLKFSPNLEVVTIRRHKCKDPVDVIVESVCNMEKVR